MIYDSKGMFEHLFHITFKNMDFQQFTEHIAIFFLQYLPLSSIGLYEFNKNIIRRLALSTHNDEFFSTPEYLAIDKNLLKRMYLDPCNTGNMFTPKILYGDMDNPYCTVFNKIHPKGGASIYLPLECEGPRQMFYLSIYTPGRDHYTPEHLELCREIWPPLNRAFSRILGREKTRVAADPEKPAHKAPPDEAASISSAFKTLDKHIADYIRQAVAHTAGRISGPEGAAQLLGLPASTLWSKIRKYGISIDKKR